MAYTPGTLSLIASEIESSSSAEFIYITNDNVATVTAAGYFSDGTTRGLVIGSSIRCVSTTTGIGFGVTVTSISGTACTVTASGAGGGFSSGLPWTKYTTGALTAATLTAAQIAGAQFTVLNNSGATPGAQTLPAASVIAAAIPGFQPGFSYILRILNSQTSGTLTLTVDSGATWTITGHAAILLSTFVDYIVTLTSATAGTIQSIGAGDAP